VLVTGGAGFIGSHLVDALVAEGHRVRILDALVPQVHGDVVPPHLNPSAEFLRADVCSRDAVDNALEGIDAVFHEAAEVGVGQSMYEIERYVRANDLGTAVLLEAILARRSQIKKLVVASSMSIYGEGACHCGECGTVYPQLRPSEQLIDRRWELECPTCGKVMSPVRTPEEKPLFPTSVYAVTKQDQEQFCLAIGRSYKIPTVALRYFNVYGNRMDIHGRYTEVLIRWMERLESGQSPIVFGDGQQTMDFVHVRDVARANILGAKADVSDEVFNVANGSETSLAQLAQSLALVMGRSGLALEFAPERSVNPVPRRLASTAKYLAIRRSADSGCE